MKKPDNDKTLWELNPELKKKLDHLRSEARRLGLMNKIEFS